MSLSHTYGRSADLTSRLEKEQVKTFWAAVDTTFGETWLLQPIESNTTYVLSHFSRANGRIKSLHVCPQQFSSFFNVLSSCWIRRKLINSVCFLNLPPFKFFYWCCLIMRARLDIFKRNLTKEILYFHHPIMSHMILNFSTIRVVNFDHLRGLLSVKKIFFYHMVVFLFFIINKYFVKEYLRFISWHIKESLSVIIIYIIIPWILISFHRL